MTFYSLPPEIAESIPIAGLVIEYCPACGRGRGAPCIDTDEIARLIEQIDLAGYESKGRPIELDLNFKRLAEIFGVKA